MSEKDPSAGSMYGGSLYSSMRDFVKKKKPAKPPEEKPVEKDKAAAETNTKNGANGKNDRSKQ